MIQQLTGMLYLPQQVGGFGDASGDASCFVSSAEKGINAGLAAYCPTIKPTPIRIDRAKKAVNCTTAIMQHHASNTTRHSPATAPTTPTPTPTPRPSCLRSTATRSGIFLRHPRRPGSPY
ncbi:hypothetical protein BDW71DRAFT_154660 [Aspergillus fruticulosus]